MDAIKGFFASALGLLSLAIFVVPFGYHIVWCIQAADQTGSAIALLLVGIAFFLSAGFMVSAFFSDTPGYS